MSKTIGCGICGKEVVVKRWEMRRVYCGSDKCERERKRDAMRLYRLTERGRRMVVDQNKRYKRPDIEYACCVCGEKFISARKDRKACNREECRKKMRSISANMCMNKNKEHRRFLGRAGKAVSRYRDKHRLYSTPPCLVCGKGEHIHAHHHNYKNRTDVTFLCAKHHKEIHSWDSN
jgi:hypothetical protein